MFVVEKKYWDEMGDGFDQVYSLIDERGVRIIHAGRFIDDALQSTDERGENDLLQCSR